MSNEYWGESPLYGEEAKKRFEEYIKKGIELHPNCRSLADYLKKDVELTQDIYKSYHDGFDSLSYAIKSLGKTLKEEKTVKMEKHEQFKVGDYIRVEHNSRYRGFILQKKISRPYEAQIQVTVSNNDNFRPGSTVWINLDHPTVHHDNFPELDRVDIQAMINLSLMWKDEEMFSFATDKMKNYRPPGVF
jgi:hypothetical protein